MAKLPKNIFFVEFGYFIPKITGVWDLRKKLMHPMIILLGISLFLAGSNISALSAQLNPYGAYVTGSTLNDIVPAQQNQYANGDQYGSGSLTLNASGSASVD